MNFIDIFVLAVLGLFAFAGFRKGFVNQLFHASGIFCAFYFNTPVSNFIAERLSSKPEGIILFLVGVSAFFLIFAVFFITGHIFSRFFNFILTSLPNRVAGVVFGALKGFMVVTIIMLMIRSFGGDGFLKRYVTPDKQTDRLIEYGSNRLLGHSKPESDYSDKDGEYYGSEGAGIYSRLGYGAYRISTLMDPFIDNLKFLFKEKYEQVIEEKMIPPADIIKEQIP